MTRSTILSVRLTPRTRRMLAEVATSRAAAGASGLARDILERWAAETLAEQKRISIQRAVAYLHAHAGAWADEPVDFFPAAKSER